LCESTTFLERLSDWLAFRGNPYAGAVDRRNFAGCRIDCVGCRTVCRTFGSRSGAIAGQLVCLALLLAGAEPEELATAVTASLRDTPAIAFGDVIGANIAIYLVATARNSLNQAAGAMLVAAYAIFIIVLLRR